MVKLSKRLKSLVKFVADGDKIMDVGCDHALLDIYIMEKELLDKIYVCDVNPNALENGKRNIEKYEMNGKIIPILGFGIEKSANLDINTLIISGMGSNSIIEILSSPLIQRIDKLVLQSNNNYYELRKFLTKIGFNIFYEELIKDGKKIYINIVAGRDRVLQKYSEKEYLFGPVLIQSKGNLPYFYQQKAKYEQIFYKNRNEFNANALKYLDEIIKDLSS